MANGYKKHNAFFFRRLKWLWKDENGYIGLCARVMQLKEGENGDSKVVRQELRTVVESVPDTGVNKMLQLESQEGVVKHGPNAIVGDDCTDSDTVVWGDRVNCGVDHTDKGIDLNNKQIINAVDPSNFTHKLYGGGHDVGEHQKEGHSPISPFLSRIHN